MALIDKDVSIPFYAKMTIYFVGLIALCAILYITQSIVVPLVFAIIIAIVLSPIVDFLVRKRMNRILAIVLTILLTLILISGLISVIFYQISQLTESWTVLIANISGMLNQAISDGSAYLGVNPQKIHAWIATTQKELVNFNSSALGETLMTVGSGLAMFFLIPVYIFLFLLYQPIILEFIHQVAGDDSKLQIREVVSQTKKVVQRYLVGLLMEAGIVAVLDIGVLLLLGIPYAILLGILAALLNMIPYLGGIVGVGIPMAIALATMPTAWYAVYVLIAFYVIQLIDNNYIVPKIVASKVKINALFSIIVVLAGNALWGIPGMFLSLPLLAIIKLTCDNFDHLKPWGFLLGDTLPPLIAIKPIFMRKKKT
jgi:predicted PurR-regulated permease PerM